ncbi:CFF_HP2_G0027920.mRNA.1.CDS.1 [Saccharomyces cerevisiae]|nr:CFF_HP2_G0027920.mRNA.1.CDS.1 [Saccharomyces cerevisiae]CAI6659930.1 CFF_HP2_G0027920.mRNA.1.CDS.1 [Saccharomyces cerevisiae]
MTLPLHTPSMATISRLISTKCTHIIMQGRLPQRSLPCAHLRITLTIIHLFNIYISFGGPKILYDSLDTYVIPL